MSQPITAVVCGAGQRGYYSYGPYALQHPEDLRFVAVAEPDPARRDRFGDAPPLTTARESLESHLLAFAAEKSRLNGGAAVDMADFRRRAEALADRG